MKTLIKLIIAIFLTVCLFKMPYNFYQLVRIIAFVGFIVISYLDIQNKFYYLLIITVGGAILFNPLIEFRFEREVWQQIDRGFAVVLIAWSLAEILKKPKWLIRKN